MLSDSRNIINSREPIWWTESKTRVSCFYTRDVQGCVDGLPTSKPDTTRTKILDISLSRLTHNLQPGCTALLCDKRHIS